jgi:hypothetical protein
VLAELYIGVGEIDQARRIFETMIEREPERPYWKGRLEAIEN